MRFHTNSEQRLPEGDPYRIVLADDHAKFREGLRRFIQGTDELKVIGEAGDGLELLDVLKTTEPHMVILDLSMPGMGGIEAAHEIMVRHPGIKVLILTMHKDAEHVSMAVSAGVKGYVMKDRADAELFPAIETIRNGGVHFPRFMSGSWEQ